MTNKPGANLYEQMPKAWLPCDICGSARFEILTDVDRYRMGVQTCRCEGCDLIVTNPMPSEAALDSFYKTSYRAYYRRYEKPTPELLASLGIAERARHSADFFADQGVLRDGARILDIGCADGSLLNAIRERAPRTRCFGVEPNPAYAQYAREKLGAPVVAALEELPSDARFDVVIVNHVLEHVRVPSELLSRLRGLLNPGGVICIDVPDASRYTSLADLHIAHLYHFTPTSLRRIAARAGLRPSVVLRHAPPNHPLSVRGIFLASAHLAMESGPDPDGQLARELVSRIGRSAPYYFLRRSWLGRIVVGVPQRIWRAIVS